MRRHSVRRPRQASGLGTSRRAAVQPKDRGGAALAGQTSRAARGEGLACSAGAAAAGRVILRLEQQGFERGLAVAAQRAVWMDDGVSLEQPGHPAVLVVAQAQLAAGRTGERGQEVSEERTPQRQEVDGQCAGVCDAQAPSCQTQEGMPCAVDAGMQGPWRCRGVTHPQSPRPQTYSRPFWQMAALCQSPTDTHTTFLPCGARRRRQEEQRSKFTI